MYVWHGFGGILKVHFEIPHKLALLCIEISVFYSQVKI